jgi:hypothetical protein
MNIRIKDSGSQPQVKKMKEVKIKFLDFFKPFDENDNPFINSLKRRYKVTFSDEPDFIFYSIFGKEHLDHECVRIFYTGENFRPDFNISDYAIGFDHMEFGDRYLRWPLYMFLHGDRARSLVEEKKDVRDILGQKQLFCNFVYSNDRADPIRDLFFKRLSQYKMVDSLGGHLNNKERPQLSPRGAKDWWTSKIDLLRSYKFTIAFENSRCPGYTTEKIVHPMLAESIPIYWGNPSIDIEFNSNSFIWVRDKKDIEQAIDRIIDLDTHDDKWLEMMSRPWGNKDYFSKNLASQRFDDFLYMIFDQDRDKAGRRVGSYWEREHERMLIRGQPNIKLKNIYYNYRNKIRGR